MENEHCSSHDSDVPFTTNNYNITTTPKREWLIVVDSGESLADMRHGRRLQSVEDLMRLPDVRECGLSRSEVRAIVLYTGPMVSYASCEAPVLCIDVHSLNRMVRTVPSVQRGPAEIPRAHVRVARKGWQRVYHHNLHTRLSGRTRRAPDQAAFGPAALPRSRGRQVISALLLQERRQGAKGHPGVGLYVHHGGR